MKQFIFILLALIIHNASFASDLAKEKRWESQIEDSLMDGEIIHLNDGNIDFMALDMPSETDSKNAIIVIHGIGIHPNWSEVVRPIRIGLSETGLHTLSIQMPVLKNSAIADDYKPLMPEAEKRIKAAIKYLKQLGITRITLIAHSLGTQMTTYYLAKNKHNLDSSIVSFVGISMLSTTAQYLKNISLPILDLFGSKDNKESLNSVPTRLSSSVHNKTYHQVVVTGANHFFSGKEDNMLTEINKHLKYLQ